MFRYITWDISGHSCIVNKMFDVIGVCTLSKGLGDPDLMALCFLELLILFTATVKSPYDICLTICIYADVYIHNT
jgi:hypothetical protein